MQVDTSIFECLTDSYLEPETRQLFLTPIHLCDEKFGKTAIIKVTQKSTKIVHVYKQFNDKEKVQDERLLEGIYKTSFFY